VGLEAFTPSFFTSMKDTLLCSLPDQQSCPDTAAVVQANVAAFGGDPAQVTLFGQSAGAASITSHLMMPGSRGLFSRAIVESGPVGLPFRTKKRYPAFSKVVGKAANCTGPLAAPTTSNSDSSITDASSPPLAEAPLEACLRGLPWKAVVEAQSKAQTNVPAEFGQFLSLFQPYSPVVGVGELPVQPFAAILAGNIHDVSLIFGSVRQEGLIFIYSAYPGNATFSAVTEDVLLGLM
jgi:carboxylesterase type B